MSTLSHAQASTILRTAFRTVVGRVPSSTELAMAQAVAWLETGYGRAGQFAAWADDGQYNWGALQKVPNSDGSCPSGTRPGSDAGNARCFYVYESDEDAAAAFLRTLVGGSSARNQATLAALSSGDPDTLAEAMKTPPAYYEAPVDTYANAIRNALGEIQTSGDGLQTTGWKSFWLGLLGSAGIAGAVWFLKFRRR